MRSALAALWMLCCALTAGAQVSVKFALPGANIGISVPAYPELVRVPGHPVYHSPQAGLNYFFYDGMYWVYQRDNWYASSWYNGPWGLATPEAVPLSILRVPVRYYARPPEYFRGWNADAPPRWGEHWGNSWESQRRGWENWTRSSSPSLAPLPAYQRHYAGDKYPRGEQQRVLQSEKYLYQPRDSIVQMHYQSQLGPMRQAETAPIRPPEKRRARAEVVTASPEASQGTMQSSMSK